MMKDRVVSGIIIMLVFLVLIYFSETVFNIMVFGLLALCINEFIRVRKNNNKYSLTTEIILYGLPLISIFWFSYMWKLDQVAYFGIILIVYYLLGLLDKSFDFNDVSYYLSTGFFLILAGIAAIALRSQPNGFYVLFYAVLLVAGVDSGGYFFGKWFGKRKLLPQISPNKTVEGALGGILVGTILGVLFGIFTNIGIDDFMLLFSISFILCIVSIIGDLFFSMIKRTNGVKDFSNLLPFHGGLLDRIDSHLTAYIAYYIILVLIGVIT